MSAPSTRHGLVPLLTLAAPPANLTAPVVSGSQVVGQLLSTTDGTWDDGAATFTYRWLLDGVAITGPTETGDDYTSRVGDIGHAVQSEVTAHTANGTSSPELSNSVTILPDILGTDVQFWTAAGSGIGGSAGLEIASPTVVFDAVTRAEADAGDVEYRAIYLLNTHASRSLTSTVVWIASQTTSLTTDIAIGVAPQAAGSDVAAIPNESTAPAGVVFTAPADQGSGISVGTLGPGQARGIWLRWTVLAGTEDEDDDSCTLGYNGTPA